MEYHDLIALAKQTTHAGALPDFNATGSAANASCGDSCTMWVRIVNGRIDALKYEARGCVISRASAAAIARAHINALDSIALMDGDSVRDILGAQISPLRERCLTTALVALQNAVHSYDA